MLSCDFCAKLLLLSELHKYNVILLSLDFIEVNNTKLCLSFC